MKLFKKLGVKSILSIALFLLLLFSASYSFFSNYSLPNSTISTFVDSTDMVYTLRGGSSLSLSFDNLTFKTDGNGYADSIVSTDYVELQASSNIPNIRCTYELWYTPVVSFQNAAANNGVVEFELRVEDMSGTNAPFSINLVGINSPVKLIDGVITTNVNNSLVRQTYKYTLRHYNRPFSQNDHYGKSYSGQLMFKSTGCVTNP